MHHRIPESLALGDFNNDGGIDIVAACNAGNSISVLLKELVV